MTAINSNRAIRGPVTAVPVVAGKGVRLVADTENNRWVVEADETVLWENENGITGASFPITLSENPDKFERIRIVFRPWTSGKTAMEFPGDETTFTLTTTWPNSGITSIYNFMTVFSSSGTSLSFVANKFIQWGATTINTDNTQFRLFKVVGVNRIASN